MKYAIISNSLRNIFAASLVRERVITVGFDRMEGSRQGTLIPQTLQYGGIILSPFTTEVVNDPRQGE